MLVAIVIVALQCNNIHTIDVKSSNLDKAVFDSQHNTFSLRQHNNMTA